MSMFVEPVNSVIQIFDEEAFDSLVNEGKLVKHVEIELDKPVKGHRQRRVIYALPDEIWRVKAIIFVQKAYDSLAPGWHPDLDAVIGLLLGYDLRDVTDYVKWVAERNSQNEHRT